MAKKKTASRRSARPAARSSAAKSRKKAAGAKTRPAGAARRKTRKAGAAGKAAARKSATRRPVARKAAKRTAKRTTKRPVLKAVVRKAAPKKAPAARTAPKSRPAAATKKLAAPRATAAKDIASRRPNLDRERRTVREEEMVPSPPSSLNMDRSPSAARSGRKELAQKLREHTSTGPALTGGDIDADWEDAESVGDEAPGGDNPTPDQDVVDEIGKALGVEYDDDEELQGGDEIVARDRNRWELDPASKDDFEDE